MPPSGRQARRQVLGEPGPGPGPGLSDHARRSIDTVRPEFSMPRVLAAISGDIERVMAPIAPNDARRRGVREAMTGPG